MESDEDFYEIVPAENNDLVEYQDVPSYVPDPILVRGSGHLTV